MNVSELVAKCIKEWQEGLTEKTVKATVFHKLDKVKEDFMWSAIGLEYSFGRWEVRRFAKNPLAKRLEELAERFAIEWFDENAKEFPKLRLSQIEAVTETYKECYLAKLKDEVRRQAGENAAMDAERLVRQFVEEQGLPDLSFNIRDVDSDKDDLWS